MYLTPTDRHWACDIEADNLLDKATTIWCVGLINLVTKEKIECRSREEFTAFQATHAEAVYVGHNFISYDAVMLNRFWKSSIPISRIVDTFVLSQLYNPNMTGGHSLEAWGRRLRYEKSKHEDFSCFTEEMMKYCMRDVMLTGLLFIRLGERMRQVGFTERGAEIEHKAWNIIQNRQKKAGFPFNYEKAQELYVSLRAKEESLKREIYKLWPPVLEVVATYKAARKKDGEYSAQYVRHRAQYPRIRELDDRRYEVSDWVAFNLGSPMQRIEKLIDLGWRPVNLTKKGNPKVDEDELLAFAESSGKPEVGYLAKWIVTNSRANMINTWLEAYNERTGAIHGNLFLASTLRYKHSSPNSANIPAVRLKKDENGHDQIQYEEAGAYTYEVRDLWTAGDPDWSLVGVDGKGIQLRVLANYAYSDEFVARVLDGDPHSNNIKVLGLQNKAAAKKFLYCVPFESQALTRQGWKYQSQLIVGEEILTYNAEKKQQEWQPLLATHVFDSGPIVEMGHSHGFKVRSTPNHRWFTQQRKNRIKNDELEIQIKETQELTTMQNIIVNAPLAGDETSCGYDWTALPKYDTDWVKVVLDMSQQERKAFLAGFCIADGYWHRNGHWCWNQLSGNLSEAALLASYLTTDGVCRVSRNVRANGKEETHCSIGKKPHVTTASFKYEEKGEESVWCPETENHSWVMRQGDVITITGNTTLMGGGGAKLAVDQAQFGTILTAKQGNELKDKLIASIPGFGDLIKKLQKELEETGRITLCDGSRIIVPSPHMVIPYLLQGDESRLMKQALIYLYEELVRHRLLNDVFKVADIHDEWQFRVRNEYVTTFTELCLPCFLRAGQSFNYRIPIEGDFKVGQTWAETH